MWMTLSSSGKNGRKIKMKKRNRSKHLSSRSEKCAKSLFVIFLCGASGCASLSSDQPDPSIGANRVASICEIRSQRSKFVGHTIRIRGVLKSDGMTYTYLQDKSCGAERNTIWLSSFSVPTGDATVRKFFDRRRSDCERRGNGYCSAGFFMDVSGVISEDEEGSLQIELMHIYQADL